MIIALDFDKTYTEDPTLWENFIDMAHDNGHEVICVTMRYENEGSVVEKTIGQKCKIYYTNRMAKIKVLEKLNIEVDVWIDDSPMWVYNNAYM